MVFPLKKENMVHQKRKREIVDGSERKIERCGNISPVSSTGKKKRRRRKKQKDSATSGGVSRKVTFRDDVKKNDGLRPSSKMFEDILFSACVGKQTLTAKQILLYIEKETGCVFETFERVKELCADGLERLTEALHQSEPPKHVPFLNGGGGRGYGFMKDDVDSLNLLQNILDRAEEILSMYKKALHGAQASSLPDKAKFSPSPVSVFSKIPSQPPSPIEV
jgi:hypothetical protein